MPAAAGRRWGGRSRRTRGSGAWSGAGTRARAAASSAHSVHVDARGLRARPRVLLPVPGARRARQPGRAHADRAGTAGHGRRPAALRRSPTARTSRTATGRRTSGWPTRTSTSCCTSATTSTSTTRAAASPTGGTPRRRRPASTSCARSTTTAPGTRSTRATRRCRPRTPRSPWIVTWDDHETENNYADLIDEIDDTGAQRQTPERVRAGSGPRRTRRTTSTCRSGPTCGRAAPDLRIFRRFDFGRLARFNVLDTRQYRTDQPGGFPSDFGPPRPRRRATPPARSPARTRSAGSRARARRTRRPRWNVIAQQVMMSRTRFPNSDRPACRRSSATSTSGTATRRSAHRLLQLLADARVRNPVVLAGDIHSTWFSDLKLDFDDPAAPVGRGRVRRHARSARTSRSRSTRRSRRSNPLLNPHVRFFDGSCAATCAAT